MRIWTGLYVLVTRIPAQVFLQLVDFLLALDDVLYELSFLFLQLNDLILKLLVRLQL